MCKKILCLKSIHEKILLVCLSGPTIQAVSITCPKIISKKFCPKNLFAILAKFSSICEILAMFKKILCLKSIHEKILLVCLSGPTIQAVSIKGPKIISKKFCPKNVFAILAKFSSICEVLAMFKKHSMSLKYLKRIR